MKRKKLVPRAWNTKEAISIQQCIDGVQDSLDRFQVLYEEGGNVDSAILDLTVHVEDLEDAVEKAECR